ncbi:MAG TPA: Asp23/Gls24 family envelope stress response protein [Herpetosiphon sp.]|uniref:Asp23/Gls24 family envelope stress response protein n=1 Tax=Herpetosiphon aurantiacus (strain ATCC 23779 / DSM 785 / 114-95) TaxID=316274 RepID=A9AZV5_HERA2|nr:Asp23/Gls24 family envelope stress response protein [Herpetosiphon sp.]ABX07159.1 hypothetical protein Haur_4528 [Herpetosiphon aurantiacus DSM 785]HBW51080.1 Asp23/Gls24 family envelope stress response protein [Herpetosiphon sp.]
MPQQQSIVRSVRSNRHTTTIDIGVIGQIVQSVSGSIEGIYETQLESAELVAEGRAENEPKSNEEPQTRFDERASIVLHLKLIPFINEALPPIVNALRKRVIESIQQYTELNVHAVHIHIAGLWYR